MPAQQEQSFVSITGTSFVALLGFARALARI